jgi:hypothetical protein
MLLAKSHSRGLHPAKKHPFGDLVGADAGQITSNGEKVGLEAFKIVQHGMQGRQIAVNVG